MELIRLENITKTYRAGEVDVPVLKSVSLTIHRGELVALMGASGSGKTTLMNILGFLDRPTSGRYLLDGEDVVGLSSPERARLRSQKLGFVFQSFNLLPRTTVLDNVLMPQAYATEPRSEQEVREQAIALLERVGLGHRLDRIPSQLSGGEQQRVAIARALLNRPVLLLADEPTGNLDSKTSAEMLRLFQELNAEGLTVLLVTHDPEIAAHAQRVIRIRDGLLEGGDSPITGGGKAQDAPRPAAVPESVGSGAQSGSRRRLGQRFWGTWSTAIRAISRNAVRSWLTALGIVIGIAAVIAMMEIGQGSKKAIQQTIASMGANMLLILPGAASSGGVSFGTGSVQTLTPDDCDAISRECDGVQAVTPIVRARAQVIYGNRNWVPVFIYGTDPSFLEVHDWESLQDGVMFTDRDVRNGSQVCLIGQTLLRELFEGRSPLGQTLRIQNVSFKIVGVLSRKGPNMMGIDQDDIVLAPWTTIKYQVSGTTMTSVAQAVPTAIDSAQQINSLNQRYPGRQSLYPLASAAQIADTPQPVRFTTVDQILVKTKSAQIASQTIQQITQLLHERHRIHPQQDDDFSVRDMSELMQALASTSLLIGSLLLAVALISLMVGGVGIMNIMLVSVTERTREIGLRMALGAAPQMILEQFLVEAVVLCMLGGAFGIILGRTGSFLVHALLKWPTEMSLPAIAAAVGVSVTVGVVFGFYPAWKASRLDPIAALRYE
jgi:macrolide transport system ATP-binding/permease protein